VPLSVKCGIKIYRRHASAVFFSLLQAGKQWLNAPYWVARLMISETRMATKGDHVLGHTQFQAQVATALGRLVTLGQSESGDVLTGN
jgi:hypothetical protein